MTDVANDRHTPDMVSASTFSPAAAAGGVEQRRSRRFRHALDVDIVDRGGVRRGRAVDVARHGLFVAVVDAPRNRHLVQLVIHLPDGPMQAAATVMRTLPGQGVGLSLFALSSETKHRWDAFIAHASQHAPSVPMPTLPTTTLNRRPDVPSFVVKLRTVERLRDYLQAHVAVGGTVLFTPVLPPAGSIVSLLVVHPVTEAEFPLPGKVHRAVAEAPKRLEILFQQVDVAAFSRFVETGLPPSLLVTPPVMAPPVLPAPPTLTLHAPPTLPAPPAMPDLVPTSLTASMPSLSMPSLLSPHTPHTPNALSLAAMMPNVGALPRSTPPPTPPEFDLEIDFKNEDDVSMEDDPIDWDLNASELPVLVGHLEDGTIPPLGTSPPNPLSMNGEGEPEIVLPVDAAHDETHETSPAHDAGQEAANGDAVDTEAAELVIDESRPAQDPGLQPQLWRLQCMSKSCAHVDVVECGPCRGVLGLVADMVPFFSARTQQLISVPRLAPAEVRRERFHTALVAGALLDDTVVLSTFLAAADLADAPRRADSDEVLRTSPALADFVAAVADPHTHWPLMTKVRCPACNTGWLEAAPNSSDVDVSDAARAAE